MWEEFEHDCCLLGMVFENLSNKAGWKCNFPSLKNASTKKGIPHKSHRHQVSNTRVICAESALPVLEKTESKTRMVIQVTQKNT